MQNQTIRCGITAKNVFYNMASIRHVPCTKFEYWLHHFPQGSNLFHHIKFNQNRTSFD